MGVKLPSLESVPSYVNKSPDGHANVIITGSVPTGGCKVRAKRPVTVTFHGYPGLITIPSSFRLCSGYSETFGGVYKSCTPMVRSFSVSRIFLSVAKASCVCPSPITATRRLGSGVHARLNFAMGVNVSAGGLLTGVTSSFRGPSGIRALFPRRVPMGV